jgi:hypothetical protein
MDYSINSQLLEVRRRLYRWRDRVPSDRVNKRDGFADRLATSAEYPE